MENQGFTNQYIRILKYLFRNTKTIFNFTKQKPINCFKMKEHGKFRKLKIHTKFQSRAHGEIQIPEIRIEGKWLDALGFKQGQTVIIEQEQNKLTIRIDSTLTTA